MITYLEKESDFSKELTEELVLVDFYADWCGPCQAIAPVLDELDGTIEGLEIVKVDTDRFMSLARDYHIITVPNIKIFSNGKVVKEKEGIMTKDELISFINS